MKYNKYALYRLHFDKIVLYLNFNSETIPKKIK